MIMVGSVVKLSSLRAYLTSLTSDLLMDLASIHKQELMLSRIIWITIEFFRNFSSNSMNSLNAIHSDVSME